MINRFFFLFSALVFLLGNTSSGVASFSLLTHTQHTPIELKPISLNGSFQVASVCFLGVGCGDGGFNKGDELYEIDTAKQCINEGYGYTSCTLPSYLEGVCPYNENYYRRCIVDNEKACGDSGYVKSCSSGEVLDDSQTCPYDTSFKKCKCNPCDGYTYSYSEATAQGYVSDGSCQSCNETKYKRKENPCSGYTTCECGGATNAKTCYTGTTLKYNSCKACCENRCTLATCPENHTCDYEACSDKYCDNGCATGFSWKEDGCKADRASCRIGWIYYADGTCVTPAAHNTSKVALGVVVYVNPDGIGGQVMSSWPVDENGNKSNSNVGINWTDYNGSYYDIAALPNYTSRETAMTDFNSCNNTDKIVAAGDASTYPAAWAARKYAPTTETKGKWCLPAAGVMTGIDNNQSAVQAGIRKLGGVEYPLCCTWSSSEYDDSWAWNSNLGISNGLDWGNKSDYRYLYVRPVLEF